MKKYTVYIHTINGRSYIGYTSKSIGERLHKHLINAFYGIDSKFYRSIRKYGPVNIISKVLGVYDTKEEAIEFEKKYINEFNTYANGLNSTLGGDGGDIISSLSPEKLKAFWDKRKDLSKGENNGRYSGFTDEYLISKAVDFFKTKGCFIAAHWRIFCKKNALPQNYSKFRFKGQGMRGLISNLKDELKKQNIQFSESNFKYDKNNPQRLKKLSKSIMGRHHYNDGKKGYMLYPSDEKIKSKNLKAGLLKNVKN